MLPVVTFTACERMEYLRPALESWSQVRGIGGTKLCFRVEPGCDKAARRIREVDFAPVRVVVNRTRHGELGNPWHAIELGFAEARDDFVVYAEDDDIVSEDVLEYFAWCRDHFRGRPEVLTVNAFRQDDDGLGRDAVELSEKFTSWVFGTWRDRWHDSLRADWDFTYEHKGWDWRIIDYWVAEQGRRVAIPGLSRSQHIGTTGVHFRPGDLERLQSRCFSAKVPPMEYKEAARATASAK